MFDLETPALILKFGRFPLHHGTLGIIRSLGSVGIPVYAALEDLWVPAGWSRYLAGKFVWNPDENADPELLAGLTEIGERIGRPAVIIPTSDHAAIFINEYASALAKWFLFPAQQPGLTRALADKRELQRICQRTGVAQPITFFPTSADEARRLAGELGFPIMVKITEPWRRPRPPGLAGTSIVRNSEELTALFRVAEAAPELQLMIQEHIPSSDVMLAGYCDQHSRCLVAVTGEKLRSYPAGAGMTSTSRATDNREIRCLLEDFLSQLGFRGIFDLELRLDCRDGRYKLLDFNPRTGADFRLYENAAGIDVVRAMHLDLTARTVPQTAEFRPRSFIVENHELLLMLKRQVKRPTFREWLRSFRGEREFAWFSRRDAIPFIMMWLRLAYAIFRARLWPAGSHSHTAEPEYRAGRGSVPAHLGLRRSRRANDRRMWSRSR